MSGPVWVCGGCGMRLPVGSSEEGTLGWADEPRPCAQGADLCNGTMRVYATDPRRSAKHAVLITTALAMAAVLGSPLDRDPAPPDPFRGRPIRPDHVALQRHPALGPLPCPPPPLPTPQEPVLRAQDTSETLRVSPRLGSYDAHTAVLVVGGIRVACPDTCGDLCPRHGAQHRKRARRARAARRQEAARSRFEVTIPLKACINSNGGDDE